MFYGFAVSFDSKDNDGGKPGADLLRLPHWLALPFPTYCEGRISIRPISFKCLLKK